MLVCPVLTGALALKLYEPSKYLMLYEMDDPGALVGSFRVTVNSTTSPAFTTKVLAVTSAVGCADETRATTIASPAPIAIAKTRDMVNALVYITMLLVFTLAESDVR
jgi:hypothetical protein